MRSMKRKGQVTASASLPPQHVADGQVKVELTEGKVGHVAIDGRQQTSEQFIDARLGLQPGDVVDVPQLTERARILNATSDLKVRVALQPGTEFGLTDVALSVIEPPRDTLQLFADNQ